MLFRDKDVLQLREKDVHYIHRIFFHVQSEFYGENTVRKNYFISTCMYIHPEVDFDQLSEDCPYGGIIGIGNSYLDVFLKHSKDFQLHAIFHDAAGYLKSVHKVGPGYCYIYPFPINCCFLGHLTGLGFCLYLKLRKPSLFNKLLC
jgi:hypothetical protein